MLKGNKTLKEVILTPDSTVLFLPAKPGMKIYNMSTFCAELAISTPPSVIWSGIHTLLPDYHSDYTYHSSTHCLIGRKKECPEHLAHPSMHAPEEKWICIVSAHSLVLSMSH